MTNVLINKESLEDIADAIRSKNGQTTKYKPAQMADAISAISGGGGITPTGTKTINISSNGTITEDVTNYASAQVNVNVPNPSTGTKQITTNGDHDVTDYATAHVAVPQPSGSTSITQNGTHDVTNYASASVNVPNSYSASDEGKVVSNGALVSQTSRQITANGTLDTTLNDEVVVNVPTGITPTGTKQISITENGTTTEDVTNYANAEITVNVQASGGGVHTEEGYVELTDVNVGNSPALTIPVDLTSAQGFVLNLYVVETGEVADGVVTKYDHIEIPTAFADSNHNFVWNYMVKFPRNASPTVYRDSTNVSSISECNNASYTYNYRGRNGAQLSFIFSPTISASGVVIATMNGTRFFCMTGAYVKFKYEIKWW